ncbi:hypothetical protein BJ912DRAFT_980201 [Pholiota molesta]|nr:hypothetical protein BJ912DRAFT_980201 [Pholiota molesta]
MAYGGHSNSSITSSQNPASGSSSLAEAFRCQSKIADLTYRLSSLSNLPLVVSEIIQFVHSDNNYFIHYQTEIIMLVELARKNLESAGVVPYLWASCPKHLLPHKSAYVDLLRALQSNERYVDTELQKRVRVLLMPLTSTFTMSPDSDMQTSRGSPPRVTGTWLPSHTGDSRHHESQYPSLLFMSLRQPRVSHADSTILAPDAFPVPNGQAHDRPHIPRSSEQRLWHSSELRENVAPTPVAFYQPPTRQRFGIFLTGNRTGRPTH